jgi:hypothetical protein
MERLLDGAYRMLHAAYDRAYAAFQLVDLIWSIVWAAVKVGGGSILGVILALAIQVRTAFGIYRCFFGPEFPTTGEQDSPFGPFIPGAPIISAFILFAVGESVVVIIIFFILDSLFTFKLTFLLGSRGEDAEGHFSPIGDGTTDADDPLSF